MKLNILTDCSYTHKGYEREDYQAGQQVDTDDAEFAAVALSQGWAVELGKGQQQAPVPAMPERSKKALAAAPENKSAQ